MMPVFCPRIPCRIERYFIYITQRSLFSCGNLSHFSCFLLTLRFWRSSAEVSCGWLYYFCDLSGFRTLALRSGGRKVTKASCQFHQVSSKALSPSLIYDWWHSPLSTGWIIIYLLSPLEKLSLPPSFNISFFERKLLWGAEVCCRVCKWLVVPLGRGFLFYSHVLIYWVVYLYIRGSVLIYLYTHAYTHILTYINIYIPTHIYAHVDIQYVHAYTQ